MPDALESKYENELNYVRRLGAEFARERPKIADRLLLDRETGESVDPHVERLIEAFAFLTARIRLKLDDDYTELTDAMLGVLYPHYLNPIPSMAIVHFELDPARGQLTDGFTIPRHSRIYSREIKGVPCRFRTTYPTTLWPLEVQTARYVTAPFGNLVSAPPKALDAPACLQLTLRNTGQLPISQMSLERLRFFLAGDEPTVRLAHEMICNHTLDVLVRGDREDAPRPVGKQTVQMVGFGQDEGLLPYHERSFIGYRLLTEYFCFPQKFMFIDLVGLHSASRQVGQDLLEVFLFFDRNVPELETRIKPEMFRLGCSPVVNLFSQHADPLRLTETRHEYLVLPDIRHPDALEVYSIDKVYSTNVDRRETREFQPFYDLCHEDVTDDEVYWQMLRRPSPRKNDAGTNVYLSLANASFDPRLPPAEILTLETTCSNRDLPGMLRAAGGEKWQFQLEGQAPVKRIAPVVLPTVSSRQDLSQTRWRLVSHLALNHLSLTSGTDGGEALRELLRLYDYVASKVTSQHIDGILNVSSRPAVAPIRDEFGAGFCRGIEVDLELDEKKYAGSGLFLFSAVLDRFFALYASINSATRLVVRGSAPDGFLKRWPFRTGERSVL